MPITQSYSSSSVYTVLIFILHHCQQSSEQQNLASTENRFRPEAALLQIYTEMTEISAQHSIPQHIIRNSTNR